MSAVVFWVINICGLFVLFGVSIWPRHAENRRALRRLREVTLIFWLLVALVTFVIPPRAPFLSGLAVCVLYIINIYVFQRRFISVRRIITMGEYGIRLCVSMCVVRPRDIWFYYEEPRIVVTYNEGAKFSSTALVALGINVITLPDSIRQLYEKGLFNLQGKKSGDTLCLDPEILQKIEAITRNVLETGDCLQLIANHISDPPTAELEQKINEWLAKNISAAVMIRLDPFPEFHEESYDSDVLSDNLTSVEKY